MTNIQFQLRLLRALSIALFVVLMVAKSFAATVPNTVIENTASAFYGSPVILGGEAKVSFVVATNTPAEIDFLLLRSNPLAGESVIPVLYSGSACSFNGNTAGPFTPTTLTTYDEVDIATAAEADFFVNPAAYSVGDPVFVRIVDFDENEDGFLAETVVVTVLNKTNGDSEVIVLTETGLSTGVFIGGIQALKGSGVPGNCVLDIGREDSLSARYEDGNDVIDTVDTNALIDPFGVFFDSLTGDPVDNVQITLINSATNLPAEVFSPNGLDSWPSTVISGVDVVDSSGRTFEFLEGEYRFPLINAGDYYYQIEPIAGYSFPSQTENEQLQLLPTAPYVLTVGSRGEIFNVPPGPDIQIDIPLDPVKGSVYIQKSASTDTAAIGDFIAYTVTVTNEEIFFLENLVINDKLPQGFRLQEESLRLDGAAITANIASNGRDTYVSIARLEAEQTFTIEYVVEITSGAQVNEDAINYAQSAVDHIGSNIASAEVFVTNELFNDVSFLIGRVYEGSCEAGSERVGISSAKIYLEDGRSVTTGQDGRWHFAGLEPGVHVLRLDEESIADGYELLACSENSRNYGSPNSAFVDLKAGALWRHDFVVKRVARDNNEVSLIDSLILDREFADVATMPTYDESFVTSTDFKVMWPPENYTPRFRVLKAAVQHKSGDRVNLILNGVQVSPLNRRDSYLNPILLSRISTWVGLDLKQGSNTLEIEHVNKNNQVVSSVIRQVHYSGAPYKARFLKEKSQLKADGQTPIIIAVELSDEQGFPVRAGTSGVFKVSPPYQAWLPETLRLENDVLESASNESRYVVRDNGIAYFPLDATTQTGRVVLDVPLVNDREEQVEAWLEAATRDWILIGLAEGSTGYEVVTDNLTGSEESERESYDDGRVAFYGKGRIPGEYLLTIAYDTAGESSNNPNSLLGDVNPDEYYSVYGDESLFQDEAESARRLYLKIERKQFYALFGDFQTGMSVTELSRYNRTLNGIKSEYKDDNFEANIFAAETSLANLRDELEGKGITGPYNLSRSDVVVNSEQIEIEVRDRFQTGRILSTTPMSRGNDYDIDYNLGVIRFRNPVSVRDPLLNPIYIIVNYETQDDREAALVAGGRGEISTADDRVEFGVSYITEENKGSEAELGGVDLKIDITENLELRSEYATSENTAVDSAEAWTINLEQDAGALTSRVYATEIEGGFGVGQQNASEEGSRKIGAETTWRFAERYELAAVVDQQQQLLTDATNSQASVNARRIGDKTALQVGYRIAESKDDSDLKKRSELVDIGASYQILPSLRLDASSEFSVNEKDDADLFPTRNTIGAEWQMTQNTALFATQEITSGSDETESTKLGMRTSLWDGADMNIGVDQRRSSEATQLSAVAGFAQRAQLTDNITLDVLLDQGRDLSSESLAGFDDFKAGSIGLDWRYESWTWNNRIETRRTSTSTQRGLRTGVLHQLEDGRSAVVNYDWINDEGLLRETRNQTLSFGYADRRSENFALLNRLDLRWDETDGLLTDLSERKVVSNNALNLTAWENSQLSLAYSAKYVVTNVNDLEFSGVTDFIGAHYRHDLGKQWDVGVQASALRSLNANNQRYSYGLSVGYSPIRDLWLELGYNFEGFSDDDFDAAKRSIAGTYFSIRLKFDEGSAGRIKKALIAPASQSSAITQPLQQAAPVNAALISESLPAVNANTANAEVSIIDDSIHVAGVTSASAEILADDGIEEIMLHEFAVTPVSCDEKTESRRFIQLATYSDPILAKEQLAKFNISNSYLEQYNKPDGGKVLYRLVLGPYIKSKAELKSLAEKYEKIVGNPSWIKNKTCEEIRSMP